MERFFFIVFLCVIGRDLSIEARGCADEGDSCANESVSNNISRLASCPKEAY